jgi:hypothetical protein
MADLEDALKTLDESTQEARIALAKVRKIKHSVRTKTPVRNPATKATKPIISMGRAAPQLTTGTRARLPPAAPATSTPTQIKFAVLAPSHPPTFPARVGGQNSDGGGAIAPSLTWWNNFKRKRMNPIEQAEGYAQTRSVCPFLSVNPTDTHAL